MFLDHPTITATNSQTEPDRIERLSRIYGYVVALAMAVAIGLMYPIHKMVMRKSAG